MTHTITSTRADLECRRRDALRRVGMSADDLAERARTHVLSGEEWDVRQEVADIDFLLGD